VDNRDVKGMANVNDGQRLPIPTSNPHAAARFIGEWVSSLNPFWLPVGLFLTVLLSRAAFITDGFGSHPDEWRVVRSGAVFWLDGMYVPSRLPGYPFNELLMGGAALLGGPRLCALLTTLVSAVTALLFLRWVRLNAVEGPSWPAFALALHPWFWASGITALDPAWGLGLLVAALLAIETRNYFWAGFASGLAIGFRPTAALWGGVLLLSTIHRSRSLHSAIGFVVGASIPVGLLLALLFSGDNYLKNTSSLFDSLAKVNVRQIVLAAARTVEFLGGIPGAVAILTITVWRMASVRAFLGKNFGAVWPLAACCILFLIQYVIISDKPEYLFPIMPFMLLTLAGAVRWQDWTALLVIFIVTTFVALDLGSWGHGDKPVFDVRLVSGPVPHYVSRIQSQTQTAARLASHSREHDAVIREDVPSYHVFERAYIIDLLRYSSVRGTQNEQIPLLLEFIRRSRGEPLLVREWNEIRISEGSLVGLYYPAKNTLLIESGSPDSDQALLMAARSASEFKKSRQREGS